MTSAGDRCVPTAERLDLNDVSFLLPLPRAAGGNELMSLAESGPKGALLPPALQAELPKPLSNSPMTTVADVKIVSARVDPCFVASNGAACRRQIRLVGQPLTASAGKVETVDATVPLFYDLSKAELRTAVARLRALKAAAQMQTACKPLGIHPVMAREGLTGPYALALRSLLRDLCGASNLTRVAVMQVGRPGTTWTFSAFDVAAGRLTPVTVPNLAPETSQGFTVSDTAQDTAFFQHGPDSKLPLLLRDADLRAASVTDVESAVREALRIENPARENPGTVDCVSCHLTDRARHLAESVRGVTLPATPERYVDARFDLSLKPDGAGIRAQRAFGYFADQPSIIQRVVNESAEAARQLELLP